MGDERPVISPRNIYLLGGILVALFVTGSFFDYTISQSLLDQTSGVGVFFAAYGEAPALLAWVASGTLFIVGRTNSSTPVHILHLLVGGGLILMGTGALIVVPMGHWGLPLAVHIVVALVLAGGTCIVSAHVAKGVARHQLLRVAVVLAAVVVIEMLVVTVVKIFWQRPRMRMIGDTDGAVFTPWWSPGYADRADLIDAGVASSEFKSFPSGHVANAATLMLLTAFTMLKDSFRRSVGLLFWIGAAWALVVAYSRIVIGAHFLSDTVVSLTITFVAVVGVYHFVFIPPRKLARHANS